MIGTGLYIAKRVREMPDRIQKELLRAEEENARYVLNVILEMSSGPYSQAELDEMYDPFGPYSRRGPHPPDDPAIINIQSEVFIRSWRQEGPVVLPNGAIETNFVNDSREAEFLAEGTDRMIARPLAERVLEEVTSRVNERREQAIARGVEGGIQ